MRKWHVGENWHWAVGPAAALRKTWAAYKIAVVDAPKTIQGVTVHNISHTEGPTSSTAAATSGRST